MAFQLAFWGVLILRSLILPVAIQASRPLRAPAQLVNKLDGTPYNGSAVPGDSPVKYHNDPRNDLFKIEKLEMHPNPCVIESYCTVDIIGEFLIPFVDTTPHVSFNVTSHLPNGRTGLIAGEDAFCNWVDIIQGGGNADEMELPTQLSSQDYAHQTYPNLLLDPLNPVLHRQKRSDKLSCPPDKGKAHISSTILILDGFAPAVNYTVKVKVTEEGKDGIEGRTIFDLWTEFELKYKDGYEIS